MGLLFLIPVLLAVAIIGIFILNYMDIISIEKVDTPLARVILVISFVLVVVFVFWFVFTVFSMDERGPTAFLPVAVN